MATSETIKSEQRDAARTMLEGYGSLCIINTQLLKLIEDADNRLISTTAQMGETRGSGTAKDAIAVNIAAIHEAAGKLIVVSAMYAERLDAIINAVDRVNEIDPLAAKVLSKRYMEPGRMPEFAEIGEDLGYSADYMMEKHLDGLNIICDLAIGQTSPIVPDEPVVS